MDAPKLLPTPATLYGDEDWYRQESAVIGGSAWHFVTMADALPHDDSYVVARVFDEEIFVQSTGGALRAFRNVCSHRGFPLRVDLCGRGRIECGFHGWNFDCDGVPTGIPRNNELFGLTVEQKRARRLDPVRVEAVGQFVFACLASSVPPLRDFLGPYASVLEAMSEGLREMLDERRTVLSANWKLHYEITLDDYHLASVHPATFGAGEPVPKGHFFYTKKDGHSSMMKRRDVDWVFASFFADCARGSYDFSGYKIHQIFPSLVVATARDSVNVWGYEALGASRTRIRKRMYAHRQSPTDGVADVVRSWRQVEDEDFRAVETHQEGILALRRQPTFGALEDRVAWFRDTYHDTMRGPGPSAERG